jgi:hypothetical protein
MAQLDFSKSFARAKQLLPKRLSNLIRSVATASLTPVLYGYNSGFFLSCFKMKAVSKDGEPLPWYTYPSIEFLRHRTYQDKLILEFGGGQSTLWWAKRAKHVVTLEGNQEWTDKIKRTLPANVDLHYVSMRDAETNAQQVRAVLASNQYPQFDVIIIDGLHRNAMIEIACDVLAVDGAIVCDNAEGYGFQEGFKERGLDRVDFYGNAPGVILPHCTSLYFKPSSFVFSPTIPIAASSP